jgi:hypothetical protein
MTYDLIELFLKELDNDELGFVLETVYSILDERKQGEEDEKKNYN